MFIWDLFFTHAETLKKKKSSNRYRKIVKRSWRKYVLTRWTKTSDRTDRIIDPFPGMDEKTSCSVLSRKGTGVWNRVFNKRGKIFDPQFKFAIMAVFIGLWQQGAEKSMENYEVLFWNLYYKVWCLYVNSKMSKCKLVPSFEVIG